MLRNLFTMKEINLVHVLIIGTTLMYLGKNKNKSNKLAFYLMGLLGLLIPLLVHFPKKIAFNYWTAIQVLHYLFFLPWFLFIAYNQNITDILVFSESALLAKITNFTYKDMLDLNLEKKDSDYTIKGNNGLIKISLH